MRYGTIVVDPPWKIRPFPSKLHGDGKNLHQPRRVGSDKVPVPVPYKTLSVREIAALPIRDIAADDSCLYLWTINSYLEASYAIAREWGFKPGKLLVWAKKPKGRGLGSTYASSTEFILFCRRGKPETGRINRDWFTWPRGRHSQKPEAFYDMVETVSPGPYLDMFARRTRIGWEVWGDEVPGIEIGAQLDAQTA